MTVGYDARAALSGNSTVAIRHLATDVLTKVMDQRTTEEVCQWIAIIYLLLRVSVNLSHG
jgi:hypothetical protein